jgi:hypothetical protein
LTKKSTYSETIGNYEKHLIKSKKYNICNKFIITKADKGNSPIITQEGKYNRKITDFINNGEFELFTRDSIDKFQKQIRQCIRRSINIIRKEETWKYINLNPTSPNIKIIK